MGNLDFTHQAGFSWYCILLLVSGAAMLAISFLPRQSKGGRIANVIFGAGFFCYSLYLMFFFTGGTYFVFFKAFILPVVLIVNTIRTVAAKRQVPAPQPQPAWQPTGAGQMQAEPQTVQEQVPPGQQAP
ncbi:MAG TPA: hypothetical protein VF834_25510 [Streptosporangiaceae bacterium]